MNNINITINASQGATVNIYNYPQPYRTIMDKEGLIHTFFNKDDYDNYVEELQSKNK